MKYTINDIEKLNQVALDPFPKIKRAISVNYAKNVVNRKLDKTIFDVIVVYVPK